ncbi:MULTISPECIES: heat-inducible transcriptional repressor HrcA [Clostridiaceae]|uniref:Heat-inducible transcription repressor HrcA n=1 Tax=Clostridium facile TaxID=2763035 RepID=A0ABR7IT91_9CLOT|nr:MULTISPECIES: heat-inducible transcriptional repressor HrcA [Clostridiaceae]MBC5788364.1 heat-inducible transcription repressor HrcA [Clostridium facile]PWM98274.1 MAG: heat-inducible transcription repressor HrcA [Massilioclostridium sp.]
MKSDDRRLKILQIVVDSYIRTGEPIGSKTVAALMNNEVSSATIRNDMAMLERLGFLEQPHTSAGRIPTYLGYRIYINKLMRPSGLSEEEKHRIDTMLQREKTSPHAVVENALEALAEVTGCAAVNTSNLPKFSVITKVEVVPAGRKLYALLMITSTGEIKNKICRLEFDLNQEQLSFFENLVKHELLGKNVEQLTPVTMQNMAVALGSYMLSLSPLLYAIYELSDEISRQQVEMKGERNLLRCRDFDAGELIHFINTKNEIGKILSSAFDGINVVFGKETDTFTITNSSLILSKYGSDHPMGSFGVIGPIRLDYSKIIPYMEYFSESVSRIIDNMMEEQKGALTDGEKK